jgi:hypothetical protein
MSYFSTPYKYGKKTKAQIDAISTSILEVGDNVFNTDINKEEFWTGSTWLNDDCIEATNVSGSTLSEGQLVSISETLTTATVASVKLSSQTYDNNHVGVIYRGGLNNAKVVIAGMGYYRVKFTSGTTSTTRQHIAQINITTDGQASSTASKTGGTAAIGVITESYTSLTIPADRLIYCWINSAEAF